MEIGSGLGIVSLAAAKVGWKVVATDYDEQALVFIRHNAERNGVLLAGCEVQDWRNPRLGRRRFHRLYAADVLYETRHHEPIADCISKALRVGGVSLVCDPNRSAAKSFRGALIERGLTYEAIEVATDQASDRTVAGIVYRVERPKE
jgi:predicted nicotinamide N-methyase